MFLEFDVEKIDVIRQEVDAYLVEPLQSIDCFNYWSSKAEQWPRLCKLFR